MAKTKDGMQIIKGRPKSGRVWKASKKKYESGIEYNLECGFNKNERVDRYLRVFALFILSQIDFLQ